MSCIYNSRDLKFKKPFGAVEVQTKTQFKVNLPSEFAFSKVYICFYDFNGYSREFELAYENTQKDSICYGCSVVPEKARVLFYYFRIEKDSKTTYIRRNSDGSGYFSENDGPNFQLTVFQKDFKTPDFAKGGIYYQIFPDRFYFSKEEKKNVPSDYEGRSTSLYSYMTDVIKDVPPGSSPGPVVVLTHRAKASELDAALAEIVASGVSGAAPVKLRVL